MGEDRHQLLPDDYRIFYVHKQNHSEEVLEIISLGSVLRNSHKWHIPRNGTVGVFALVTIRALPVQEYP